MKKRLLFVIDSLDCAGAEKSLVSLLSLLDYSRYSVDLMLFAHGHMLEALLPEEVNVLEPLAYTKFAQRSFLSSFLYALRTRNLKMLRSRIQYSLAIRKRKMTNPQKAGIFWRLASSVIKTNPKQYDVAIAYAQGVPTFYVADKVVAKQKYAWVNVSYRLDPYEREFQQPFYDEYNGIVAVSYSTRDIFIETFPQYARRIEVIFDIHNADFINQMADMDSGYLDDFKGIRILTIGRLAYQKGYDIAIQACKLLKLKGIRFRWYVLGKGPLHHEIKAMIKENGLDEDFILLGVTANPYPYIKKADLYVQTSRYEGFGLAIAEARMLNVPVVATRFDAVFSQMVDGKNGLVVDMNAEAVCEGILRILRDRELRSTIQSHLKAEKKGNMEELNKFYRLIG